MYRSTTPSATRQTDVSKGQRLTGVFRNGYMRIAIPTTARPIDECEERAGGQRVASPEAPIKWSGRSEPP